MRVIPLGTSSGVPTLIRNVSAVALSRDRGWNLLDCGEGTQYRIMAAPLRLHRLEAVFISHLHGDHLFGLPGLMGTMGLQRRQAPLRIFGPTGIRRFLDDAFSISSTHLPYEVSIMEVSPGRVEETEAWRVDCALLDHRVPAFGYRFLHVQSGLTVAYCTDTRPCESAVNISRGADLLIHEATYLDELRGLAHERGHSTAAEAAGIAARAEVGRLLITHFSPRYLSPVPLLEEARGIFPSTFAAQDLEPVEFTDAESQSA